MEQKCKSVKSTFDHMPCKNEPHQPKFSRALNQFALKKTEETKLNHLNMSQKSILDTRNLKTHRTRTMSGISNSIGQTIKHKNEREKIVAKDFIEEKMTKMGIDKYKKTSGNSVSETRFLMKSTFQDDFSFHAFDE